MSCRQFTDIPLHFQAFEQTIYMSLFCFILFFVLKLKNKEVLYAYPI